MKKLINICGTARCGSTMVDLILGNDPRGFSLGEIYAWFRPYRTHHFSLKCSCDGSNCPWYKLKDLNEKEFHAKAFDILNVDFLVDSSKNLAWVIDNNIWAYRNGIQIYNVLLFKEPISLFYSFWKRGFSINKVRNKIYIKYYKRFFDSGLPFIALNYNKFVSAPSEQLKKICESIDIPYFVGKENFWEKIHHQAFGSMGTRKQVEKGSSVILKEEKYPQEYKKLIPEIEKANNDNKPFQDVMKKLAAGQNKVQYGPEHHIKKPCWYYLLKLKQQYRQRFPAEWKYNQ